jgi:branched-chain amino acid transport system permease protein
MSTEKLTPAMKQKTISFGWIVAAFLLVIGVIVPFVLKNDPYYVHIFILVFLFGYLSTAWGLVGQSGQLSFGHAVFVGLGGYTSTILFMDYGITPWVGMFAGVIVAALFGLIIGYPTLRLRGPYFALSTLAFGLILQTYVVNTPKLGPINLRGAMGLLLPLQNGGDAPAVFQFATKTPYYFIALGMMVSAVLLSYALNRTRIGFYWTAIRSDQDAAESLGVNADKHRLLAFLLSCALTALGGTFWAQYFHYINPERGMALSLSIEIVLVGVVGGWQTVTGPMIGAMVLIPISELLRAELGGGFAGLHTLIYGLILMGFILWLPNGLNPLVMRGLKGLDGWVARRSPAVAVGTPEKSMDNSEAQRR